MPVEISDELWAQQIGAALTEAGTARLLSLEPAAERRDPGLLQIRNRDGETFYQYCSSSAATAGAGVARAVETLTPDLEPLTIAPG
jgi:hypothetical protein